MDDPASQRVRTAVCAKLCTITLDDPSRRNALGSGLLEQLERAIAQADSLARHDEIVVLLLRATGRVFCSGFDLEECVQNEQTLAQFVRRLSALTRAIRAMPAVVVAQVQGAALAGGCAIVAACDIVCASEQATFGYPVHRIGLSPAVSLPTLMATVGCGSARTLALSSDVVDAKRAQALGLVHTLACDADALEIAATALARAIAVKSPVALRATKLWLNELDGTHPSGSLGAHADSVTEATAALCTAPESRLLLADFWKRRKATS
ncbi:MAG: enoyl-CoA hydratase/isomerase family protein [Phycisphaerales bacterium]|nr:enoyl-CoA hydratase/isomerase family protein [Phycisphaerales bacterium]